MKEEEFWRRCLEYECGHCWAKRGDPCHSGNARKAKPHSARQEAVRRAHWSWRAQKTAPCPTCQGSGRVKVVGQDATHTVKRGPERLVGQDSKDL